MKFLSQTKSNECSLLAESQNYEYGQEVNFEYRRWKLEILLNLQKHWKFVQSWVEIPSLLDSSQFWSPVYIIKHLFVLTKNNDLLEIFAALKDLFFA